MWHDAGGALYGAVMADFLPNSPGPEIVVSGASGVITLITRQQVAPGDITCDGAVNLDDLLAVITQWGPCPPSPAPCPANIATNGLSADRVDIDDLLMVIVHWQA
jgi:hypothetical protein